MRALAVFIELRLQDASVLLRLQPDRERSVRALAHGCGYALSYLDATPSRLIRDVLARLAASFERASDEQPVDGQASESAARSSLERAVHEVLPHATLHTRRRVPVDQRVPRWPLRMRSGAPDPSRQRLWPYDVETAAMRLGRRRLVLREWLAGGDADADAAWLESQGLVVRRVQDRPDSGPIAIFAAFDEQTIEEALTAHRESCSPTARFSDGARWMGAALGYPQCCVEAFARVRTRDDVAMFADLLPPLPSPPATPLTGWLLGALTLLSHAPCALDCAASRSLAAEVLAELDHRHPGFEAMWQSRARGLHAIDLDGRSFVLAVDGSLFDGELAVVTAAHELMQPDAADHELARVIAPADFLRHAELRVIDHQLVASVGDRNSLCAALVADHRAPIR